MSRLCFCGTVFDIDTLTERRKFLEARTSSKDFWSGGHCGNILAELSRLSSCLHAFEAIHTAYDELNILCELLTSQYDEELSSEFTRRKAELLSQIASLRMKILLTGEYDSYSAIMSIHAGSGGIDAQDWASMLFRMYTRYCASEGFPVKVLDIISDDEGGIKSVMFIVQASDGYGFLKSENGIHRLVRISPFDSAKRRHTSFASVSVIPEIPDDIAVNISSDDIRIDTYRSSGAGGQYVNRTDSAVRLTHIPTGIVVTCQNERSQHMNKQAAMRVLRSKLYDMAERERERELLFVGGEKKVSSWGSQIRSYICHPYAVVKDHRTHFPSPDFHSVFGELDGNISPFILS